MQLQFFFLPELILHKYYVEGYVCVCVCGGGGVLLLVFRGKTKDVVIDHQRRLGD